LAGGVVHTVPHHQDEARQPTHAPCTP
jgi:hypothetical protein